MKKIIINEESCIRCGLCASMAPKNIELDSNNGQPVVILEITPETEKEVNDAADSCPMGAIEIVETAEEVEVGDTEKVAA